MLRMQRELEQGRQIACRITPNRTQNAAQQTAQWNWQFGAFVRRKEDQMNKGHG
jgi:hypothetical protein